MSHLQLTPELPPLEDDPVTPIDEPDEPDEPMTEAVLHEVELDRAADEGMIEPPEPEDEPADPAVEAPGRA